MSYLKKGFISSNEINELNIPAGPSHDVSTPLGVEKLNPVSSIVKLKSSKLND